MKATPPLRLVGFAGTSLGLLTAQFGLRAVESHPLRTWLLLGFGAAVVCLVVVVVIALKAMQFTVSDGKLHIGYWWKQSPTAVQDLTALSSVAFTTSAILGRPIAEVTFTNGASYRIPVRYAGGAEVVRLLFYQLGENVAARNAA